MRLILEQIQIEKEIYQLVKSKVDKKKDIVMPDDPNQIRFWPVDKKEKVPSSKSIESKEKHIVKTVLKTEISLTEAIPSVVESLETISDNLVSKNDFIVVEEISDWLIPIDSFNPKAIPKVHDDDIEDWLDDIL